MDAKVLDGRKLSAEIREELKGRTERLRAKGIIPGLAGVLVGEDPGSTTYINLKEKASGEVGIRSEMVRLPGDIKEEELLNEIGKLNSDAKIHGIFIQLPLPGHLDENRALTAILPDKDVDGFHPVNVGRAWMGQQAFLPATPVGIYEMLIRSGYSDLRGKDVVIVNVDNLVGKPLASILAQEKIGANVTLCHPSTPNLTAYTRQADIVVVAVDKPKFLIADMVKDGVIAIDFGANYIEDPSSKTGKRLVGDLDFEDVKCKAEAITPVPGGVGPMTVTMLLANTVTAAERQTGG
ncbi:MAG: bifunctional 5,10-methylene-tetrahydrofolate dehydrogenase/5,10-methylene-tetrahydrofolate cyclohydrolase [Dehalococcoidia bacterium]|nr:bifunctional 5,10-methylene-tetrahydrofolate dehydrogenase/5,10-methylene-tetrahydrofolate cyclohydrolase [Dehalococcoidia bacterium]